MSHRSINPHCVRFRGVAAIPLRALAIAAFSIAGIGGSPRAALAQWSTTYETFYLQAPHNWVFRDNYQGADRLFNAFDYGHAILYEKLWTQPGAQTSLLENDEYNKLTRHILVRPPRVPLVENAIEVNYAKLAPEAKAMFDWSHILHRQIYDVLADERLDSLAKDREVARLVAYYRTRPELAFSAKPKSMKLMQEQPFSLAFRKSYPKFNGLIWGYHWLQVGLYEPLVVGKTAEQRQAGVRATVARFWQMLADPLTTLPFQMPMTAAVAPAFADRYPDAAIIFDNLHSMHDVVSDILANSSVPRSRKRAEILLAAQRFRDDTSYVMTVAAWRNMSVQMGVENMGGMSVGFLASPPTPTVTRGAVMQHDDATGAMIGFAFGSATGAGGAHDGMEGMDMSQKPASPTPPATPAAHAGMDHAAMERSGAAVAAAARDSATRAFAGVQQRGMMAMGVDQTTSTHHFDDLADGGRIALERNVSDSTGIEEIRRHLQGIAKAFGSGDFSTPAYVHMRDVPGAATMAARRALITYTFRPLPRGGELRIVTRDALACAAVHEFLAFQRSDHRVP